MKIYVPTSERGGIQVDGAYAEYAKVPEAFAIRIPESLDPAEAAPLLCAGATAYGAVKKAELTSESICCIIGCGGLGLYAVQYAKLTGAKVIAVDTNIDQLLAAAKLGADFTVKSDESALDEIQKIGGVDAIINFAPTCAIWPLVEGTLSNNGRFVSVAMPEGTVPLSLSWLAWITPKIMGVAVGQRDEVSEAVNIAAQNNISIPIETTSLESLNHALDRLARKPGTAPVTGRVVVDFS